MSFLMKNIFLFLVTCVIVFQPVLIQAATPTVLEKQKQIDCSKAENINTPACGGYQLNDLINIGIRVSEIILGLTGSLALLAFVYGGFMFLISSGNVEKIEQAKKIIGGAIIGIIIVFTSYLIIGFVLKSLGIENQRLQNWSKPQQLLKTITK